MKKSIYILLFALLIAGQLSAQFKLKMANKYYDQLAYPRAAELYQDLAESDKAKAYEIRRTAECYRLIEDYKNAEYWYATLVDHQMAKNDDYYHYAQTLKSNGNYDLANQMMQKVEHNSISKAHQQNSNYVQQLYAKNKNYTITSLSINSSENDFSPYLYNGSLIFSSSRGSNSKAFEWEDSFIDIYQAQINNNKIEKAKPINIKGLNTRFHDCTPVIFKDMVYFTRSNMSGKKAMTHSKVNLKLYYGQIVDRKVINIKEFPYNSDNYGIGLPALSANGDCMYFVSDMPGGYGETDIWRSQLIDDSWSKPENLGASINTEDDEMFPSVTNKGTLIFASRGHLGLGGLDIYYALPDGDSFQTATNFGYLVNTRHNDFGMIFNEKTLEGYLSSDRKNGEGKDDIYSIKLKTPLNDRSVYGQVTDMDSGDLLSGASVKLYSKTGQLIAQTLTNANGHYNIKVTKNEDYLLTVENENYMDYENNFSSSYSDNDKGVNLNPSLELAFKLNLEGLITDRETGEAIEDVQLTITNEINHKTIIDTVITKGSKGHFSSTLYQLRRAPELHLSVYVCKEGYLCYKSKLKKVIHRSDTIYVHKEMDLSMKKTQKGDDIGEIIALNPIYFDFGKANIRPDAAIELDKIVKIMKDNPNIKIELGSHTDSKSSSIFNRKLSDKRAKSSSNYIISQGINKIRITSRGYGESKLKITDIEITKAETEAQKEALHQLNRRTEFIVVAIQ